MYLSSIFGTKPRRGRIWVFCEEPKRRWTHTSIELSEASNGCCWIANAKRILVMHDEQLAAVRKYRYVAAWDRLQHFITGKASSPIRAPYVAPMDEPIQHDAETLAFEIELFGADCVRRKNWPAWMQEFIKPSGG